MRQTLETISFNRFCDTGQPPHAQTSYSESISDARSSAGIATHSALKRRYACFCAAKISTLETSTFLSFEHSDWKALSVVSGSPSSLHSTDWITQGLGWRVRGSRSHDCPHRSRDKVQRATFQHAFHVLITVDHCAN